MSEPDESERDEWVDEVIGRGGYYSEEDRDFLNDAWEEEEDD